MAYNWNRSGERVIPISIEGDRPRPTDPYPPGQVDPASYQPTPYRPGNAYPHPPIPPTRRHYGRDDPIDIPPSYPPPPVPVPAPSIPSRPPAPAIKEAGRSHPDFRSHELDEMDTLAEMLKQKREAENKIKSRTPYRNNYAEATGGGAQDESLPEEPAASHPPLPVQSAGNAGGSGNPQMGFFLPAAPNSAGSSLPYPTTEQGLPPYPPAGYGNPSGTPQPPYPNPYR